MSNRMKTVDTVAEIQPHCVNRATAASMAGVSPKTLDRLAAKGENMGRIVIGLRRVVYRVDQLKAWLDRQSASQHRIKGGRGHE